MNQKSKIKNGKEIESMFEIEIKMIYGELNLFETKVKIKNHVQNQKYVRKIKLG